jgi:hypothetical protein
MSQKSSVPQAVSFVSQVLKRDTGFRYSSLRRSQLPLVVTARRARAAAFGVRWCTGPAVPRGTALQVIGARSVNRPQQQAFGRLKIQPSSYLNAQQKES